MRWNDINFHCGNTSTQVYNTPKCMNHESLKTFVKEFEQYKKQDAKYPAWIDVYVEKANQLENNRRVFNIHHNY